MDWFAAVMRGEIPSDVAPVGDQRAVVRKRKHRVDVIDLFGFEDTAKRTRNSNYASESVRLKRSLEDSRLRRLEVGGGLYGWVRDYIKEKREDLLQPKQEAAYKRLCSGFRTCCVKTKEN